MAGSLEQTLNIQYPISMDATIFPQQSPLSGTLQIPGDKSISHRAIIFSSLCEEKIRVENLLMSDDCLHTATIFKQLGVPIEIGKQSADIQGVGLRGLRPSKTNLDVGNSGTSIRLLTGLLAAQPFDSVISGDEAIQTRPMRRIITPLSQMGAKITGNQTEKDTVPPLHIHGNPELHGIDFQMPIASAQVKSALILAGLYASGPTTIHEPAPSRDHTERMLQGFQYPIQTSGSIITLPGTHSRKLIPTHPVIQVPSDVSSAAFFLVLGALSGSAITLPHIGLNPTRDGIVQVLKSMGAKIETRHYNIESGEPVATLEVQASDLRNGKLPEGIIPNIIDEIPILAVAGLFGSGILSVRNATELRVKESDRIRMIVSLIRGVGAEIEEFPDGFDLPGTQKCKFKDFEIDPAFDHRIAMSAIILSILTGVQAKIKNVDCIRTSFPNFFECLDTLGIHYEMD